MWQLKVIKPNHLPLVLHQFYAPISIPYISTMLLKSKVRKKRTQQSLMWDSNPRPA